MTAKTIRRIPTFFVVAAIGVAAVAIWPTMRTIVDSSDEGLAVITVSFTPAKRSGVPPSGRTMADHVMFQIIVGDSFMPKEFVTTSPQVRTVAPKATGKANMAQVIVTAEQLYGKELSCMIVYPGLKPSKQTKPGPTFVRCAISVKVA